MGQLKNLSSITWSQWSEIFFAPITPITVIRAIMEAISNFFWLNYANYSNYANYEGVHKAQSPNHKESKKFFWLNYANYSDYGNYGGDFFKKQSQSRDHKAQTKGLRFFLSQLRQLEWLQQLRRRFSGKKPNHAITVITQSQKPRNHTLVLPLVSQVKVMSGSEKYC